jgi:hypothetical protein
MQRGPFWILRNDKCSGYENVTSFVLANLLRMTKNSRDNRTQVSQLKISIFRVSSVRVFFVLSVLYFHKNHENKAEFPKNTNGKFITFIVISRAEHSSTFKHQLCYSSTFKALNFYFWIQAFSRTFKACTNPDRSWRERWGTLNIKSWKKYSSW